MRYSALLLVCLCLALMGADPPPGVDPSAAAMLGVLQGLGPLGGLFGVAMLLRGWSPQLTIAISLDPASMHLAERGVKSVERLSTTMERQGPPTFAGPATDEQPRAVTGFGPR